MMYVSIHIFKSDCFHVHLKIKNHSLVGTPKKLAKKSQAYNIPTKTYDIFSQFLNQIPNHHHPLKDKP